MKFTYLLPVIVAVVPFSSQALELSSKDIKEGQLMAKTFEFSGMGCTGANISPQLSWINAPQGTKSFALTAFDPDAPTGSGWWHWIVLNIPASTHSFIQGASGKLDAGLETRTDFGKPGFGGACPPVGHGMHRYQFTIWALAQEKIDLPVDISPAVVGFTLNAQAIGKSSLTATYVR